MLVASHENAKAQSYSFRKSHLRYLMGKLNVKLELKNTEYNSTFTTLATIYIHFRFVAA